MQLCLQALLHGLLQGLVAATLFLPLEEVGTPMSAS